MKHHWKYWLTVFVLGILLAVFNSWWLFQSRQLPLSQCSEVYRQYRHQPGVRAAFIKDMPINDTLRLDMTLLEAEDSAAFTDLLREMGKSEEYIVDLMSSVENEDTRFIRRVPKGHPELPRDTNDSKNDLMATFPGRYTVAFIHSKSAADLDAAITSNLRNKFKIYTITQ